MKNLKVCASLLATVLMLAGCNKKEEPKSGTASNVESKAPQAAPPSASQPTTSTARADASSGTGTKAIQTQVGMTGDVEVDVVKASIQEGILTVTLSYRNTGSQNVELKQIDLDDVYFISEAEKKKYHVLKDDKEAWIASPVARGKLGTETGFGVKSVSISPGSKAVVWFKFPAPPENVTAVNLVVPDVMPFDKLPVSR